MCILYIRRGNKFMIDKLAKLRCEMAQNNIRQKVNDGHYVVSKHAHEEWQNAKFL